MCDICRAYKWAYVAQLYLHVYTCAVDESKGAWLFGDFAANHTQSHVPSAEHRHVELMDSTESLVVQERVLLGIRPLHIIAMSLCTTYTNKSTLHISVFTCHALC